MSCPSCAFDSSSVLGPYRGTDAIFQGLSIHHCHGCGLDYAFPQPAAVDLARFYECYWNGKVAVSSPSTRRYYLAQSLSRVDYVHTHMKLEKGQKVLDFGAGLGLLQQALQKRGFNLGYTAIEADRMQLGHLKTRLGPNCAFDDLERLPSAFRFDLIVLAHVLEHMPAPNDLLQKLMNRLLPGGLLFVEVPNKDYRYKSNYDSHLLFFGAESLTGILSKHGHLVDLVSVGTPVSMLRIPSVFPDQGVVRMAKETIKGGIAALTPNFTERQIARYQMNEAGGDRQWLRALVRRA